MNVAIEKYKKLIDRLVERRAGVERVNVIEHSRFSPSSTDAPCNDLVSRLSAQDRQTLAQMLESARAGGMHDVLSALQAFRDLEGLEFRVHGEALPPSPFGTEMHWDFIARCQGTPWPDEART
jgi:hypothetical protein